MTIEEAKELEVKLANSILNNIPFAQAVQVLSNHATTQARQTVDSSSTEELEKINQNFEKADEEAKKAQASEDTTDSEQEKTDLPDD